MASRPSSTGPQQAQQEGGGEDGGTNQKSSPQHSPPPGVSKLKTTVVSDTKTDEPPGTPLGPGAAAPGAAATLTGAASHRGWLLFNDFSIAPCLSSEVTEIYGGQKTPVLIFFTRVEELALAAVEPPVPPTPVLTPEGFLRLCRSPPIQVKHRNYTF